MMPSQTLALDVYGTLIDTSGVLLTLRKMLGGKAIVFSETWRNKQLEYSFRRGLMNRYVDFSICTQQALEYTCNILNLSLSEIQKKELMDSYKILPAFPEVKEGIEELKDQGHRVFAYSNGSHQAINELLNHAEILPFFDGIVSMQDVQTFKPSPLGYAHFIETTKAEKNNTWMVSGNSFDVIGAASYGMKTIWVKRNENAVFDPWEYEPRRTISVLTELSNALSEYINL